eukprot:scaffold4877_cov105-Pinguiococcus_pyrenoidosus.AAC.1
MILKRFQDSRGCAAKVNGATVGNMIKAVVTLAFACLLLEADAFGSPRAARWRMTLGEAPT